MTFCSNEYVSNVKFNYVLEEELYMCIGLLLPKLVAPIVTLLPVSNFECCSSVANINGYKRSKIARQAVYVFPKVTIGTSSTYL